MKNPFRVFYHTAVVSDDIPKLDKANRIRIKQAIEQKIMVAPETFGLPLRRSLKGYRKLRVGDYRIVYRGNPSTVLILAILHRRMVYEYSKKRI